MPSLSRRNADTISLLGIGDASEVSTAQAVPVRPMVRGKPSRCVLFKKDLLGNDDLEGSVLHRLLKRKQSTIVASVASAIAQAIPTPASTPEEMLIAVGELGTGVALDVSAATLGVPVAVPESVENVSSAVEIEATVSMLHTVGRTRAQP